MAAIKSKNTGPEILMRKALRAAGASGYRLHVKALPGRPDVAFTRWKVAVFVDGVFWHGHPDHWQPDRASDYWRVKIAKTQERDRAADETLAALGWSVVRIWDHDLLAHTAACVSQVIRILISRGWRPPS